MPALKITDLYKSVKYGVVANSITELKAKAQKKLNLSEEIVLELEDGTIVDEEDYFSCLPQDTLLVLVPKSQYGDSLAHDAVDSSITSPERGQASSLAHKLMRDVSSIITFSTEELEMLANASPEALSSASCFSESEVENLQEVCHQHLIEREKTRDAIALLEMYKGPDSPPSSKRYKHDNKP